MNTTLEEFYDLSMEKIGPNGRNQIQECMNKVWKDHYNGRSFRIFQFTVYLFWYLSGKKAYKTDSDAYFAEQLKKCLSDTTFVPTHISSDYGKYLDTSALNKNLLDPYKEKYSNPAETTLEQASEFIKEKIRKAKKDETQYTECVNWLISKGEEMAGNNKNKTVKEIEDYIKELITNGERQIIFTGAPGTGKTRMAKKIAEEMINERKAGEFKIIQFHPSYDYTDFVEGIKPIDSGNGEVVFRKIDGQFKKFCRNCFKDKDGKTEREEKEGLFFFIIDEINRADLSKVFGEIMYCLDKDKRGENGKLDTQYQFLPTYDAEGKKLEDDVYKDGFYIPRNVVILGTMNDIDRSVESMDFALRRRFSFVEFEVTKEMIEAGLIGIFKEEGKMDIDEIAKDIAERLDAVNEVICGNRESLGANLGLNKQYYLSHGILANLGKEWDKLKDDNENFEKVLKDIFERRIKLTLKEYVRGEDEKEVTDFIKKCEDAFYERKPGTLGASAADHSTDGQDENGEQN